MEKRIYLKDWLELKPYDKQTVTDGYYLKICNEVKDAIIKNDRQNLLQIFLTKSEIVLFVCFLTTYFEDLISETNIWNSFIKAHQKLYNKQLPFLI